MVQADVRQHGAVGREHPFDLRDQAVGLDRLGIVVAAGLQKGLPLALPLLGETEPLLMSFPHLCSSFAQLRAELLEEESSIGNGSYLGGVVPTQLGWVDVDVDEPGGRYPVGHPRYPGAGCPVVEPRAQRQ